MRCRRLKGLAITMPKADGKKSLASHAGSHVLNTIQLQCDGRLRISGPQYSHKFSGCDARCGRCVLPGRLAYLADGRPRRGRRCDILLDITDPGLILPGSQCQELWSWVNGHPPRLAAPTSALAALTWAIPTARLSSAACTTATGPSFSAMASAAPRAMRASSSCCSGFHTARRRLRIPTT